MQADEHHREGTPLWDSAWPAVGSPYVAIYAVVTFEAFSKLGVGSKDLVGHPCHLGDFVQDEPLDLVKEFVNVRRAAAVWQALKVGEFEVEEQVVPSIRRTLPWRSSVHAGIGPGVDPWAEVP